MFYSHNYQLRAHNSFRVRSIAERYFAIQNHHEIDELLALTSRYQVPTILGEGTNSLLLDYIPDLVIHPLLRGKEVTKEDNDHVWVEVQSGETWDAFVAWTLTKGWNGLENLSFIPGSVGAAPIQNIGAYGVEVKDYISLVNGVDLISGKKATYENSACEFAYRDSLFKRRLKNSFLVTSVVFKLSKRFTPNLTYKGVSEALNVKSLEVLTASDLRRAVIDIRKSKIPDYNLQPNAGSFFKNPVVTEEVYSALSKKWQDLPFYSQENKTIKIPAAWLIEKCGFKTMQERECHVHPGHALILINRSCSRGKQIKKFADQIVEKVKNKFGINLDFEVNVVGGENS